MSRIYLPSGQWIAQVTMLGGILDGDCQSLGLVTMHGQVYTAGWEIGTVTHAGLMRMGQSVMGRLTSVGEVYDCHDVLRGRVSISTDFLYATGGAYLMLIWPYV